MSVEKITDWTHKGVKILDIRKSNRMYILQLDVEHNKSLISPVTVEISILDNQLKPYYFDQDKFTRNDILSVEWNMVLTKGYYVKVDSNGECIKTHTSMPQKWYVSYLKVGGALSNFDNIGK